jgi:beta-N-acetylhexosaminidase
VGELRALNLLPYRDLLASRTVPLVMTTHMQVPALDRDLPTSLSPAVIHGVLPRELGYDGLVISDSLAMDALARFSMLHAALLALLAGTDLLLRMPDIATTRSALAAGVLSAARLDASVLRILRFKLDWLGAELARDTASVGGEDVA